jgi:hypothetical protein
MRDPMEIKMAGEIALTIIALLVGGFLFFVLMDWARRQVR